MKNILYYLFYIITISSTLYSCLNRYTHYPIDKQSNRYIEKLRKLYSSGNTALWPKPHLHEFSKIDFQDIGSLPEVEFPSDNPYSKEKSELGKILFYDPRLSSSQQIACASCHDPELAWTDNKTLSFGHNRQLGTRNSMTIMNVAFAKTLFWDGRAKSLEEQSLIPIQDSKEMDEHIHLAVEKISNIKGYEKLFEQAFGDQKVSAERISKAIATFERTIKSESSKFDKFINGKPELFSDDEVMGLHLFRTKAKCINCHNTGYFSNNKFENIGTGLLNTKNEDIGRYKITKNTDDVAKFRVPSLREIGRTGPWMHNGAFTPLRDVITFYNAGNPELEKRKSTIYEGKTLVSKKSKVLEPLYLTNEEITQLEAFLHTLNTRTRRIIVPNLPN